MTGPINEPTNDDWRKAAGIPRRSCLDLNTPAELAIYEAMQAVEKAGAHPLLTDAVILLSQARDKVADYVDTEKAKMPQESVTMLGGVLHNTLEGGLSVYDDDDAPLLSIRFINDWASLSPAEKIQKLRTILVMITPSTDGEFALPGSAKTNITPTK